MNILITGAGLIGAHAARQAVDAGNKVGSYSILRPTAIISKRSSEKIGPTSLQPICVICLPC